jgi:hypothetical protein
VPVNDQKRLVVGAEALEGDHMDFNTRGGLGGSPQRPSGVRRQATGTEFDLSDPELRGHRPEGALLTERLLSRHATQR